MVAAEFEFFTSLPIAPTRRVALGHRHLPVGPPPGPGGLLLAGVVATFAADLDDDLTDALFGLVADLRANRPIPQPRMRHRLQRDRVGLQRCRHELHQVDGRFEFRLESERGTPLQHVLCAVYAAAALPPGSRIPVLDAVAAAFSWRRPLGASFVEFVVGRRVQHCAADALSDPVGWAMAVLDLTDLPEGSDATDTVRSAFRSGLRSVHPDQGGDTSTAAQRIADLTEARRILLGSA